jgi:hypothetical protein
LYLLLNATANAIPLADASVDCVASSPPFWGLRRYLGDDHQHKALELGSEPTLDAYVANMVQVCRELRRVLTPTGVLFLEIGDSRSGAGRSNNSNTGGRSYDNGGKPRGTAPGPFGVKQLCGVPFAVAFALQADGWVWRSWMPWVKRSCLPDSATDRPADALSVWLMFTRAPRGYYFDMEAVRQPSSASSEKRSRYNGGNPPPKNLAAVGAGIYDGPLSTAKAYGQGRHFRNTDPYFMALDAEIDEARAHLERLEALREGGGVRAGEGELLAVDITSGGGFKGEHYAAYAERLIEPLIRAACPPTVCSGCAKPWRRVVEKPDMSERPLRSATAKTSLATEIHINNNWAGYPKSAGAAYQKWRNANPNVTSGWIPTCTCNAPTRPGRVFDPFVGTGTTPAVAMGLGLDGIGTDLSENYLRTMAAPRLAALEDRLALEAERAANIVRLVQPDGERVKARQVSWLDEVSA